MHDDSIMSYIESALYMANRKETLLESETSKKLLKNI